MIKGQLDDGSALNGHRPPPGTRVSLDFVSRTIIEQLQQDGRRPYADIAASLGVSSEAVEQRVEQLTRSGVIQIVAVTDPLQLGFGRQAMVGIRVDGPVQPVADALAGMDEIIYVVMTAGGYDVLCEVVSASDDELLDLVARQMRGVPGVRSTETFMYLRLAKQTYSWGVR